MESNKLNENPTFGNLSSQDKNIIDRLVQVSLTYKIPKMQDVKNLDMNYVTYEETTTDKIYTREVNSIVTDMVVNDFVNTAEKTYNFMNVVCLLFNNAIDRYCDIKGLTKSLPDKLGDIYFMYKGGNVLRLIYNEFKKSIPPTSINIADNFFMKSFKKSDSDFSIMINPGIENYDDVFDDMVNLSYVLQTVIRRLLNRIPKNDMFDVFAFTEYNQKKRDLILKEVLDLLNNSGSVKDEANEDFYGARFTKINVMGHEYALPDHDDSKFYELSGRKVAKNIVNDEVSKRSDFAIDKCDNGMCLYPLSSPQDADDLYISANRSLDFRTGKNDSLRIKFTLVRTKLNCATYMTKGNDSYKKMLGAEVIDCSITHRDATGYGTKEEYEEYKNNISYYSLSLPDKDYRLTFFGYNIPGITHDLEFMLFTQNEVPWTDAKYAKRFNRLFFMYMVDLYVNVPDIDKRIEMIENFRSAILFIKKAIQSETRQDYDRIINSIIPLDDRRPINASMTQFIRIASISYDMRDELSIMVKSVDENTEIMLDILKETRKYLSNEATYNMEVYHGAVSSMAGGTQTPHNILTSPPRKVVEAIMPGFESESNRSRSIFFSHSGRQNMNSNRAISTNDDSVLSFAITDIDSDFNNLETILTRLN